MHGDMDQQQREVIMKEFRSGSSRVLITTDLLARGIDVQQVSLVSRRLLRVALVHRVGGVSGSGLAEWLRKSRKSVGDVAAKPNRGARFSHSVPYTLDTLDIPSLAVTSNPKSTSRGEAVRDRGVTDRDRHQRWRTGSSRQATFVQHVRSRLLTGSRLRRSSTTTSPPRARTTSTASVVAVVSVARVSRSTLSPPRTSRRSVTSSASTTHKLTRCL